MKPLLTSVRVVGAIDGDGLTDESGTLPHGEFQLKSNAISGINGVRRPISILALPFLHMVTRLGVCGVLMISFQNRI